MMPSLKNVNISNIWHLATKYPEHSEYFFFTVFSISHASLFLNTYQYLISSMHHCYTHTDTTDFYSQLCKYHSIS